MLKSSSKTTLRGTGRRTRRKSAGWRGTTGVSKYRNKPQTYNGLKFGSKAELNRWLQLEQLLKVGAINDLRHHTRFPLEVNGYKIATYECDAEYFLETGEHVVEDTKSAPTKRLPLYRIKKKLLTALYGIDIQEIIYADGKR